MSQKSVVRFGFVIAVITTLFIAWVNLAVGIIGEPEDMANLMYVAVPVIGICGSLLARFKPAGMARALFAAAIAQVLVGAITAIGDLGAPVTPLLSLLVFNLILTALWLASASLFRKAAGDQSSPNAGQGGPELHRA